MKPAVRTIPFVKASACGNDFLLIDAALAPSDIAGFTRRICDRHDGVGADGVEWMSPHFSADVEIRLINADGSPAEISGNGTRCVAAYVCATQGKERISILTGAGTKICVLTARRDSEYEFETEMGKATVGPELAVKISFGRSARHSRVDGQSALRHLRSRIHPQLAVASGRDPKAAAISGRSERRVRCGRQQIRSASPFFRTRCRRDEIVWHRFVRVGRGGHEHGTRRFDRQGSRARRHADRSPPGQRHLLARSGTLGVPRRILSRLNEGLFESRPCP